MRIAIITTIALTLNGFVLPSYAQREPSNRRTPEPTNEELLACTVKKDDKNPRLGGWQQLVGRQRSEAERNAFETGGIFTTISSTQANIVTKNGEIINISFGEQDQVIRGVCRSRKVEE
jgi:hypothetical protein